MKLKQMSRILVKFQDKSINDYIDDTRRKLR